MDWNFASRHQLVGLIALMAFFGSVVAPLPPCTPHLWLNKMVESNNWSSDMNPYYPVKPCPYKDPARAPLRMQFAIFSGPTKMMYHVATELAWFITKGFPRAARMLMGREKFRINPKIAREGHGRHYTKKMRTKQFGRKSYKSKKYYRSRLL
jgi:hypothetical protein